MFSTLYSDPILVANLPANPLFGMRAYVTDATSKQLGSTVAGGGANNVAVYWSGANWIIGDLSLSAVISSTQLGVAQVDGTTITASVAGVISGKTTGAANPSATAGQNAVNGTATTYMTSDSAPAVQVALSGTLGIVRPDGTTITLSGTGVLSAAQASGANPTATAGSGAVNGTATTFMRSDAAPAVRVALSGTVGLARPDGTTITVSGTGVFSTPGGANPTATAGQNAVNGTATTFMRSDGAPAVQAALSGTLGIVRPDGTTITVSGTGVLSTPGGANPTATAGSGAVNGTATTFMRSDGAPALPVLSGSTTLGIAKVDNVTLTSSGTGVVAAVLPFASQTIVVAPTAPNGTGAFTMQGLNGTLTPARNTKAIIVISGYITSTGTGATRGIVGQVSFGTGAHPTSNAALTGTQVGGQNQFQELIVAANENIPISWNALATGLTIGTTYWVDLAAKALGAASVVGLNQVTITVQEV